MAQGAQLVLRGDLEGGMGEGEEGGSGERGCKCLYGRFTLLCSRNQHNTAKQLYPNKRWKRKPYAQNPDMDNYSNT